LAVRDPIVSEAQEQRKLTPGRASRSALLSVFLVLALVVIVAIAFGLRPRLARDKALAAASEAVEDILNVVNLVV
jgi:hypothetical protein